MKTTLEQKKFKFKTWLRYLVLRFAFPNLRAGIKETMLARGHAVAQEVVVGLEVGGDGLSGPVWSSPVIGHGVDKEVSSFGVRIVGR
jgi:hypothetical protein